MAKSTKTAIAEAPADDPVDAARAEVLRLNDQELRLSMLYRQKAGELAGVKAERGDQVLDATDPAGAARNAGQRVSALLEELESFADAARRARARRLVAIPAVFEAEASAKERQAEQLEVDAGKLEAESKRLRDALERHDDWAYVAAEGKVDGQFFPRVPLGGAEYRVVDARGPVFKRRRDDARTLREEAVQLRLTRPQQAGMLEADTVEDLVAAVHSDPMRVGPPIDAIIEWSRQAIENERRRRARTASTEDAFVPVDAPTPLHLEWRAGVIDQASHVIQPEPPEVTAWPAEAAPAVAAPAAKPAPFDPRKRTAQGTAPYDTSATPAEIAREAAATGLSVEEVAEKFGVPVPKELAQAAAE